MGFNKMNQALPGPSLLEVALGAFLGIALGAVVAVAYLVLKPVVVVTNLPKEKALTSVYYQPGSSDKAKSAGWPAKQVQFIAGSTVEVTEDELNAWSLARGTPPVVRARPVMTASVKSVEKPRFATNPDKVKPTIKAQPVESVQAPGVPRPAESAQAEAPLVRNFLSTTVPGFRFVGESLQISWGGTVSAVGFNREVTLVATGHFETAGGRVNFVADTFYLGSCPLHRLPGAASALLAYVFKNQTAPETIRLAWAKCTAASVVDGGLKLVQP